MLDIIKSRGYYRNYKIDDFFFGFDCVFILRLGVRTEIYVKTLSHSVGLQCLAFHKFVC